MILNHKNFYCPSFVSVPQKCCNLKLHQIWRTFEDRLNLKLFIVLNKTYFISESLNALGLMPLLNLLKELDLPQIPAAFTKETTDFVRQMARVKRVLGKDVFFGLDVYPDPRNRTRNVMILDIPITETPFPK